MTPSAENPPEPKEEAKEAPAERTSLRRGGFSHGEPVAALRQVTAEPVHLKPKEGGAEEMAIVLQDPEDFAPSPAVLSPEAFAMASLFDGQRGVKDVALAFEERYGAEVAEEQIERLAEELDRLYFLASPRFEAKVRSAVLKYLSTPVRPATQAGVAYPDDPGKLQAMVEGFFTVADGPGALPHRGPAPHHRMPGLVLPHIDLRVGGATYAHGYKALLEGSQADLFVILGVNHQGPGEELFSVSTKDFATPLGVVPTAHEIAARLQEAADAEPALAEYAHRGEHSVEFQVVLLKTLLGERAGRDFQIVPVLCGPVEPFIAASGLPHKDARFLRFVGALREELDRSGRRWSVLASVDFSHVGPKFGDFTSMTERLLLPVERGDRRLLAPILALDAEGFYAEVARTRNSRHVDAVLAVLTLLTLGRGRFTRARELHYDQMLEVPTKSVVSFASLAFEQDQAEA